MGAGCSAGNTAMGGDGHIVLGPGITPERVQRPQSTRNSAEKSPLMANHHPIGAGHTGTATGTGSGSKDEHKDDLTPEQKEKASRDIDVTLSNDAVEGKMVNKLLLLGAGESGKSTIFKQMILIHGRGFPPAERKTFAVVIIRNMLQGIRTLVNQSQRYGPVSPDCADSKRVVESIVDEEHLTSAIYKAVKQLWADAGIQKTLTYASHFQLGDSVKYFLDRLDVIASSSYIPDEQDVLRSRVGTTGIVENEFVMGDNRFHMIDVGGQRNERKKWIHCFEGITGVLFVAAISEYDQLLYEDEETNRIREALQLFDDICNSKWFIHTAVILFLNKRDIFAEKIKKIPLKTYFPEYDGKEFSYTQGAEFLQRLFVKKNRNPDKEIYCHLVTATDTANVRTVFADVKDIVIRKGLADSGLM